MKRKGRSDISSTGAFKQYGLQKAKSVQRDIRNKNTNKTKLKITKNLSHNFIFMSLYLAEHKLDKLDMYSTCIHAEILPVHKDYINKIAFC